MAVLQSQEAVIARWPSGNLEQQRVCAYLNGHQKDVTAVTISPIGRMAVTQRVKIHTLTSVGTLSGRQLSAVYDDHQDGVTSVAMSS
jgi:hypothetical protein